MHEPKFFDFRKTRLIDDVIIPPMVGESTQIFFQKLRIMHKFFVWKFETDILIIAVTRLEKPIGGAILAPPRLEEG